jgi:hypothetical protein
MVQPNLLIHFCDTNQNEQQKLVKIQCIMESLHSTTSVEIVVLRMIDKLTKINQIRHTI